MTDIGDTAASVGLYELSMMRPTGIEVQMDPRLQRIVTRRMSGIRQEATASSQPGEISVVAKVTDPGGWAALSEVRSPSTIGEPDPRDRTSIVTGRIPSQRIEAVRTLAFVKSLKAAQAMQPALLDGVLETNADQTSLPGDTLSDGGAGVVVGIVDFGCDFAHRNFLTAMGRTRLLSIWHQGGRQRPGSSVAYGREHLRAEIDAALTQPDPYAALGYGPAEDTRHSQGTHGTHVMDIAGGNGLGSGVPGFAPNVDFVFVDVSADDVPWSSHRVVGSSFGDSVMLLEALQYIFAQAGNRPCVINVSLGTNGGPHDGSTLVEDGIDRLIAAAANRAVTIAASNAFDDGIHARGTVPDGEFVDLSWRVPFNDATHNELELWYAGQDRITLELLRPDGTSLGSIAPGGSGQVTGPDGAIEIFAANRINDPNNGDNMIGVFLENTVPFGAWTIRLHGTDITDGDFHAWIERDNSSQSAFAPPHDNGHTIGSISCGKNTIVVGSYDAHKVQKPISWFSSAGPTRDDRKKPEVSAPGHAVLAAHSRTRTGVVPKSGTSMAAPAVAGIVALMMGEARARGLDLTADAIQSILIDTARLNPPASAWDDRYGFGRVDAAAAVATVRGLS